MNPDFFIHLPFKKNEDINPKKASHRGMNPKHLALAQQEICTLLTEGLIEPTSSRGLVKPFMLTSMLSKSEENSD